jgi:type IV secretory pathway protease TraF
LGGYYGCNPVKYGDLVLYRWGDHKNVAKFVRGLSGDLLAVRENSLNQWRLELNGQPLRNSLGEEYLLSEKKAVLIKLYARRLKDKEVLLLGNKTNGSHDSTVFGLVKTNQLSGKLIPIAHSYSY